MTSAHDALGVVQPRAGRSAPLPLVPDAETSTGSPPKGPPVPQRVRGQLALCADAVLAMLTGRYSHHNGIADNQTPFPTDSVTYASLLRDAGYTTGYVGKWHMDGQRENALVSMSR